LSSIQENTCETVQDETCSIHEIYLQYKGYVLAILHYHRVEPHDIEDVLQEVFLSLIKNPPQNPKTIKTYLYRTITNHCIDLYRRKQTKKKHLHQYAVDFRRYRIPDEDPAVVFSRVEQIQKIFDWMDEALPAFMVTAIKLRYQENLNNGQIAQKLKKNKTTVASYISTGMKTIREKQAQNNRDPEV